MDAGKSNNTGQELTRFTPGSVRAIRQLGFFDFGDRVGRPHWGSQGVLEEVLRRERAPFRCNRKRG